MNECDTCTRYCDPRKPSESPCPAYRPESPITKDDQLHEFSDADLIAELEQRKWVNTFTISDGMFFDIRKTKYTVLRPSDAIEEGVGPAKIIVIRHYNE